jgi:hypothetical protein
MEMGPSSLKDRLILLGVKGRLPGAGGQRAENVGRHHVDNLGHDGLDKGLLGAVDIVDELQEGLVQGLVSEGEGEGEEEGEEEGEGEGKGEGRGGGHLSLNLLIPVVTRPLSEVADYAAQAKLAHEEVGTLAVGHLCCAKDIRGWLVGWLRRWGAAAEEGQPPRVGGRRGQRGGACAKWGGSWYAEVKAGRSRGGRKRRAHTGEGGEARVRER